MWSKVRCSEVKDEAELVNSVDIYIQGEDFTPVKMK